MLITAGVHGAPAQAQSLMPRMYTPLVMGAGTPNTPAPPAALPTDWLGRLNYYRALANLPPVSENTAWSAGGAEHARYVVKNNEITHYQDPAKPYATAAGAEAGRSGNVMAHSNAGIGDAAAIDGWMQAPFHALGMIDPRLTQAGYGSYREADGGYQMAATLDVIRGIDWNQAGSVSYPLMWPANGMSLPYTAYRGGEYPNPLTSCPGYQAPTGAPLYVQFGAGDGAPSLTASSLTQGGVALEHCVYGETSYSNPDGAAQSLARSILGSRDAVVIIPRQPLTPGASYTASLTVNGMVHTWSFTVAAGAEKSMELADEAPAEAPAQ
jgi:uncharacterized protein YkwD